MFCTLGLAACGCLLAGPGLFPSEWVAATDSVTSHLTAAGLIARLLKHEPQAAPSDPTLNLPSPSPAQWAANQAAACKALTALNWHCTHDSRRIRPKSKPGVPLAGLH